MWTPQRFTEGGNKDEFYYGLSIKLYTRNSTGNRDLLLKTESYTVNFFLGTGNIDFDFSLKNIDFNFAHFGYTNPIDAFTFLFRLCCLVL